MGFASALRISASALTAERLNMDVIANNIANVQTTGPDGPYQRQRVVVRAATEESQFGNVLGSQMQLSTSPNVIGSGVRVVRIEADPAPGQRVYEPGNADADAEGYVTYPNVNVTSEMVNLLAATKAYQANITVVNATKSMAMKALTIGSR
jgi:flagellar basal-body rod protein FlgC